MRLADNRGRVPIITITGFLGSGKTTLINHILADNHGKERLAIVKNEIGDVVVDSEIIRGENIVVRDLLNGCVCCTLLGELEASLKELVENVHPDRIIVETSGTANPAIIAINIDRMPFVKRDLIVTVIDVVHFPGYKDRTTVVRLQHTFTDLVVLNRVGEVSSEAIEVVLDDVYAQRPGIPVIRTKTGRIPLDVLFGATKSHLLLAELSKESLDIHHLANDKVEHFSYVSDCSLKEGVLDRLLGGLSDEYFRVKGIAVIEGKQRPLLVNWVCGRLETEEIKHAPKRGTRLVFIGKGIGAYREDVLSRIRADN